MSNSSARVRGIVKWFSAPKGYGFANVPGDSRDIFVHFSAIEMEGFRTLKEGEELEFELIDGPKGPQAHDVRIVPVQ